MLSRFFGLGRRGRQQQPKALRASKAFMSKRFRPQFEPLESRYAPAAFNPVTGMITGAPTGGETVELRITGSNHRRL
jgi:hypothetical protein